MELEGDGKKNPSREAGNNLKNPGERDSMSWRWDFVYFDWVLWHINHCRLFNAKSSLYIYIKYIGFVLIGFYGISTIVGYLMPNPLYTYILTYIGFVLVGFYGISTIVGYLMPNPLYTYILNI